MITCSVFERESRRKANSENEIFYPHPSALCFIRETVFYRRGRGWMKVVQL